MNSFAWFSILLSVILLGATGCSQTVAFGGGNPAFNKSTGMDPLCERADNGPFWIGNGTTQVQCPDACPDGSHLQCAAPVKKEVVCVEGQLQDTGNTEIGTIIGPIGQCPVQSMDCGNRPHGTKWFEDTGTTENKTCDLCEDGSAHRCDVKIEAEFTCSNRVVSATGLTKQGDVVRYTNECLPVPPKACGEHASGSTWWLVQGEQSAKCQTCWDGQELSCRYNTEIQNSCTDGTTSVTGQTRQGSLIEQVGACRPQPRACGETPDGEKTWQADGQTDPYQCDTCTDGSPRLCIAQNDVEMVCNDGTLNRTGQNRRGPFIGYVNTCPNVSPISESYTVPTASPKVDVMFVLDTTPSNFKTLVSLGDKLSKVTSSWKNLDWHVGLTNANPVPNGFERHAMEGRLEELYTYPVETSRPITYLTKDIPMSDWILSRNSSFHGMSWPGDAFCSRQPYCSSSYSEPLKTLIFAFDKQNDPANRSFFRTGSTFVPVIISDNDERSGEPGATSPGTVLAHFKKKMTKMRDMKAYSIIIKPGDAACLEEQSTIFTGGMDAKYGKKLDQFAKLTGGESISLCEKDFSRALARLSQDIRQQVSSVKLKGVPYKNSLKITFAPAFDGSWVVQGDTVVFDKPLPAGMKLSITYLVEK